METRNRSWAEHHVKPFDYLACKVAMQQHNFDEELEILVEITFLKAQSFIGSSTEELLKNLFGVLKLRICISSLYNDSYDVYNQAIILLSKKLSSTSSKIA